MLLPMVVLASMLQLAQAEEKAVPPEPMKAEKPAKELPKPKKTAPAQITIPQNMLICQPRTGDCLLCDDDPCFVYSIVQQPVKE